MIKKIFLIIILSIFSIAQAQNTTNTYEELEQRMAVAEANLEVLKDFADNPDSANDNFVFVLAIPSAIGATLDFILLAGAAGLISIQIQEQLEGRVQSIDLEKFSLREIYNTLKEVLSIADNSVAATKKSDELLKKSGYSEKDIVELKEYVASRNRMCSNNEINNSPNHFCPDFKESFGRQGYKIEQGSGGWIVKKGNKFQCCLEWDNVHCGFEIFNKRGKHQGEVGCLPDEFNPCEANLNRGSHAKAQPHDHKPRSKACKK